MDSFFDYSRKSITDNIAKKFGYEKADFRANAVFRHFYKRSAPSYKDTFNLKKDVMNWFESAYDLHVPVEILSYQISEHDSSVKFVIKLKSDGALIESILIPERNRLTLCLSTQVGCAQGCRFCQTGRMGLLRNLTTAEIVGQLLAVNAWCNENNIASTQATQQRSIKTLRSCYNERISNIVYMGMGEPLDNVENVLQSTHIFCDHLGLNFSPNKVTISTVGMLPALKRVLTETRVSLALSLHSPFDEERTRILPVNAKYPIAQILDIFKKHMLDNITRSKTIFIQYILLRNINDSEKHALALISLLKGIPVKINLIPLNEHSGTSFRRPDLQRVYHFQQILKKEGMVATVRLSKGRDIDAACGQLIKSESLLSPTQRN